MNFEKTSSQPKANQSIRNRAKEKHVPLWMIANEIGKSESRFIVMLRFELPKEDQDFLISVIDKIADNRKACYERRI